MAEITVITLAHNSGKFIYQCVDSVLNQTFQDYEYIIIDNASSDGTKEVLEIYAKKDARISLYRNEENNIGIQYVVEKLVSTEYFMVLDHDDYLELDALDLLYEAAVKENLDMVFGSCEMEDEYGKFLDVYGEREVFPCIGMDEFLKLFTRLYWNLRTLWGKLIRTELIKYIDEEIMKKRRPSQCAFDTAVVLAMAFHSERLGTVGKIVHHYRVFQGSDSYRYRRQRFLADWVILDYGKQLLKERDGLTLENCVFLYRVYKNAIFDTLRMATTCECAPEDRMGIIREIVEKEHTQEMRRLLESYVPMESREFFTRFGNAIGDLFLRYRKWSECKMLMQSWLEFFYGKEAIPEDEFNYIYSEQIKVVMLLCCGLKDGAYNEIRNTNCVKDCPSLSLLLALTEEKDVIQMARLLIQIGEKKPQLFHMAEKVIDVLLEQNQLCRSVEKEDLRKNPDIVASVCAGEYEEAMNRCLILLSEKEWQRSSGIMDLAISLAAVMARGELFVMLKKCSCEFLFQEGEMEKALEVLADLEEMCPEDAEVHALRAVYMGE